MKLLGWLAGAGGAALSAGALMFLAPPTEGSGLLELRTWLVLAGLLVMSAALLGRRDEAAVQGQGPHPWLVTLLVLNLTVALGWAAWGHTQLLRQVRAQRDLDQDARRAAFLDYQLGVSWAQLEAIRRQLPPEARIWVVNDPFTLHTVKPFLGFYLQPRRLYFPPRSPFPELLGGEVLRPPTPEEQGRLGLDWMLLIEPDHEKVRLEIRALEVKPR